MEINFAHQREQWPNFCWEAETLAPSLARIHFKRGQMIAAMANIGFEMRQEAILRVLTKDISRSSEIEGEHLDEKQVRSSLARRMGLPYGGLPTPEQKVEGLVEIMLDATLRFDKPLTKERLFGWHNVLFPMGYSGLYKITVADWRNDRDGPMVVVSGRLGNEAVHFQAPSADRLPLEMDRFLDWFERGPLIDPILKAGLAHLWFVTIHPFEDGNGRIGRAIMDMALARADGTEQRFYSMTSQIHADKDLYYERLETTQKGNMDVTGWLAWFLERLEAALASAEGAIELVQRKQTFWDVFGDRNLNGRQIKLVNLLFDGLDGRLRRAKYASIAKCSDDTALRDLTDLVEKGILRQEGVGRATHYVLSV